MTVIEDEDREKFMNLFKLTYATPTDKSEMAQLCNKYHLSGCNICANCSDQVRRLHQRLMDYYNKNK